MIAKMLDNFFILSGRLTMRFDAEYGYHTKEETNNFMFLIQNPSLLDLYASCKEIKLFPMHMFLFDQNMILDFLTNCETKSRDKIHFVHSDENNTYIPDFIDSFLSHTQPEKMIWKIKGGFLSRSRERKRNDAWLERLATERSNAGATTDQNEKREILKRFTLLDSAC